MQVGCLGRPLHAPLWTWRARWRNLIRASEAAIVIGLCICAPMSWAMLKIRANEKGMEKAALYNGTLISIMTPLGLILGGVLLELGASWSSFFWIVAAGYLILLGQVLFMPETPEKDRVKVPLDWAGSLGLGAWLVCFLLALSFGESWGWDSAAIITLFVLGAVILGAWIYQQRVTDHALMDFKGMDVRQVTAGYSVYCTVAITASVLRQAVYPSQREQRGVLPGRGKRQVCIQSREQGAVGPDCFPSQPQPGTALGFHQISGLYPSQPGHPGRESRRLHQAGDPSAIGVLGGAQQHAVPGKALELASGGIKANVHQDVVADEHVAAHITSSLV